MACMIVSRSTPSRWQASTQMSRRSRYPPFRKIRMICPAGMSSSVSESISSHADTLAPLILPTRYSTWSMPSRRAVFHAIRSLSGSWPDRPALMRVLTPSSRMIHRLGRSPALVTSGVFTSPIRDESPVNNALPSRSSKSLWKKLRSSQRSVSMPAGRIQYWSDRLNPMERSSSSFPEGMPVAMSSVRRPSLVAGIPRDRHHAVTESLSGRGCPSTYMPTGTRLGSNTSPTSRMRPAFDEYANSSTGWFRHISTRFISNSIGPRDYGGWIHCFPFPMVATWMSFVHVDVPGETDGRNRVGKPLYGFPSSCSGRL